MLTKSMAYTYNKTNQNARNHVGQKRAQRKSVAENQCRKFGEPVTRARAEKRPCAYEHETHS